jgi:hypothetical protein
MNWSVAGGIIGWGVVGTFIVRSLMKQKPKARFLSASAWLLAGIGIIVQPGPSLLWGSLIAIGFVGAWVIENPKAWLPSVVCGLLLWSAVFLLPILPTLPISKTLLFFLFIISAMVVSGRGSKSEKETADEKTIDPKPVQPRWRAYRLDQAVKGLLIVAMFLLIWALLR